MPGKSQKPLNGNHFEKSTTSTKDNQPNTPLNAGYTPEILAQEIQVNRAIHGLIFNLLPHPSDPGQWTDSLLLQVLLKDNIFEDVLKKYVESIAKGSIEIPQSGPIIASRGWDSWSPKLTSAGTDVLKERLKNTTQVQKLKEEFLKLGDMYLSQVKSVFVKKDWTQICVVVATAAAAGAIVAGMYDFAASTKNDEVAWAVTGIAGLIPAYTYEAGTFKLKAATSDIEWKPSQGTWSAKAFTETEWKVKKDVTLKGRVEVAGSEKGVVGKATAGATFSIGHTMLDSVTVQGTLLPTGSYELVGKLEKSVGVGDGNKFDFYVGAKYSGRYDGDPGGSNAAHLIGGVAFKFGK